jgi:snRNA-activating protein complex subunit 3
MAEILEDATPIEPGDELDASDLRITSEEEALAEALRAAAATPAGGAAGGGASPPAQAPSASERTKTAVSEPASAPGADSPAGGLEQGAAAEDDGVPASALRQAEKLAVQQAHDASVARIRQERVAARAAAAGSLRSLREAAPDAPGGGDAGGRWRRKKTFSSMGFRMKADPAATSENRGRQLQRVAQASAAPAAAAPAVPAGQVVLHVAVHLPQAPAHVSEEWLVLGSQRLTALRDALYCLTEVNVAAVEREEGARCAAAGRPPLRLRAPSAYLYVEGTFYNDMRAPDAVDYSAHIRQYNT